MELKDLKRSVAELPDEEVETLLREMRTRRRTPKPLQRKSSKKSGMGQLVLDMGELSEFDKSRLIELLGGQREDEV